ncbi:MAG: hypothetical protein ACI9OU_002508 [Candidatus Promineifilaceae bacterium]
MTQQEFFEHVIDVLGATGIPYMITGSVAAMIYGEPRLTNDMDVVVQLVPNCVQPLLDAFDGDQYYAPPSEVIFEEMTRHGQFNIIHVGSGSKVDFILRKDTAFAREEFSRRQTVQFTPGIESVSATPEDVVISKLMFYQLGGSRKHLEDIAGILRLTPDALDRSYLEHWASSLGLTKEWTAANAEALKQND